MIHFRTLTGSTTVDIAIDAGGSYFTYGTFANTTQFIHHFDSGHSGMGSTGNVSISFPNSTTIRYTSGPFGDFTRIYLFRYA